MQMTDTVRRILAHYEGETPGVKAQLARMLMTGRLA
ncbi:MAG: fructose-bisphosphate aldolase, partial [Paracoccus sp.]|nr:fructose-bisphosphate aldolase [Paracoccus sp. (in: a-proteobacteria)]